MVGLNKNVKISKQVDLGIEEIIMGISTLETVELESFMQRIGQLVARRKFHALSDKESELLLKINNAIPTTLQEKYTVLSEKLNNETITPKEHSELLVIVEKLEAKYVKRLEHLIELAHFRNTSLEQLMKQLNLNLPDEKLAKRLNYLS